MKELFNNLNTREQAVLLAGAVVLLVFLLYFVAWQPLREMQVEQNAEYREAVAEREAVRDYVRDIQSLPESDRSNRATGNTSLTSLVNDSLQSRQLQLTRIQQLTADQLSVRLENVGFGEVLGWIYDLETIPGVLVGDLAVRPAQGARPGMVNVTVGLSRLD